MRHLIRDPYPKSDIPEAIQKRASGKLASNRLDQLECCRLLFPLQLQ